MRGVVAAAVVVVVVPTVIGVVGIAPFGAGPEAR